MKLQPDFYFSTVCDIPPRFLLAHGITGLVLDIDNTLAHDGACEISRETNDWLASVKTAGVACVIVSNNTEGRARDFAALCDLPYVAPALKPSRRSLVRVAEVLQNFPPQSIAVVGDQFFTDILYARRAGYAAILVDPLGADVPRFVKMKRWAEHPLRRRARKKGYTQP